MVFSESKCFCFRFAVQQTFFFATKTIFLRHKVLTEYFLCPFQRQTFFPTKTIAPPPFKLNGCSLSCCLCATIIIRIVHMVHKQQLIKSYSHVPVVCVSLLYWNPNMVIYMYKYLCTELIKGIFN